MYLLYVVRVIQTMPVEDDTTEATKKVFSTHLKTIDNISQIYDFFPEFQIKEKQSRMWDDYVILKYPRLKAFIKIFEIGESLYSD